jgi:hypothetical protein
MSRYNRQDQFDDYGQLTKWQKVWAQSKANGAPYTGDALPVVKWEWPTNTFLALRLRRVRKVKPINGGRL